MLLTIKKKKKNVGWSDKSHERVLERSQSLVILEPSLVFRMTIIVCMVSTKYKVKKSNGKNNFSL
jgi:hypothetical protein